MRAVGAHATDHDSASGGRGRATCDVSGPRALPPSERYQTSKDKRPRESTETARNSDGEPNE